MNHGACNCCQQPICDAPALICDSISASKSKCGCHIVDGSSNYWTGLTQGFCQVAGDTPVYSGPTTAGKRYKTQTVTYVGCSTCPPPDPCPCSGSITAVFDCSQCVSRAGNCAIYLSDCCGGGTAYPKLTSGSGSITCTNGTGPFSATVCPTGAWFRETIALTDEYTTTQLKTDTANAIGIIAYPNTFTGVCGPSANLSPDESSYSISRSKYKVRHYPTASCYLKAWVRKRFQPAGTFGPSDVVTDLATYVWTPGGSDPCLTDNTNPYSDIANRIDSAVLGTEDEPTSNGVSYLEIKKWSCLSGYTPDDPNIDGTRPSPDINPNGWPTPH